MALTPGGSPDPLSLTGSSPTKKRKSSSQAQTSPTLRLTQSFPSRPTLRPQDIQTLTMPIPPGGASKRPSIPDPWASDPRKPAPYGCAMVEAPVKSSSAAALHLSSEQEDSTDCVDWGEVNVRDDDGDWKMSASFRSPSPRAFGGTRPMETGSARTGERDMRSEFSTYSAECG
jgi:hypothetical protein